LLAKVRAQLARNGSKAPKWSAIIGRWRRCVKDDNSVDIRTTAGYRLFLTLRASSGASKVVGKASDAVVDAITSADGNVQMIETHDDGTILIHADASSTEHQKKILDAIRLLSDIELVDSQDGVISIHQGGKIDVISRVPLNDGDDLAMSYTPGVGRISSMIAEDKSRVWELTGRRNAVAVLSNGTAVLGLGDIGPEAAMPVMEGKAVLFRQYAGIAAYPICVNAQTADELVAIAKALEPTFGGINLEDVAAPVCFEAEAKMRAELSIPVFHDDQHGTAVVTLAAMLNACKVVGKKLEDIRVVMLGAGAAGVACAKLLLAAGVGDVTAVDRFGAIHKSREDLEGEKLWLANNSNRADITGSLQDALVGADAFMGLSGPNLVEPAWVEKMSANAIVFAMANPVPEIMPEKVPANVAVVATGRSDYPNQINNVLVFPGFFRGLLDAGAHKVTDEMKLAAAFALADVVSESELSNENIIPSPFNENVASVVASAVGKIAEKTG
jgi:malate dehydrogenase (oxaloacetate-decarboxylating)